MIFSRGNRFDVFLLGPEGETGVLTAGGQTGKALYGVTEPVYYVAPDIISEDEVTVQFWARISKEGGGGSGAGVEMKAVEEKDSAMKVKLDKMDILNGMGKTACAMGKAVVKDKCVQPPDVPRCSGPRTEIPEIVTKENKNGFAGEIVSCGPNDLAFFQPSKNQFFTPYDDSIEICFDEEAKTWRFSLRKVEVNVIIDECPENLASYRIIRSIEQVNHISDKCCAWDDFNGQLDKYPVEVRRGGYIIYKASVEQHEQVHKSDYEKDIETAKKRVLEALKGINAFCEDYPTYEAGKKRLTDVIKNVLEQFKNEVTRLWDARIQDSNYELKTQSDTTVSSKIRDYIRALGLGEMGCTYPYTCK